MSGSSSSATLAILPTPPHGRTGWPWTEATPSAVYSTRTDWPRVTIITPSYNQAAFLEETLRSTLLQGYPNLEYIVIDGGSTDGSRAILEKYSPWLDSWVSEPDRGQSDAINKGLARATGEWVNWLNSDDCLLPGALASLVNAADSDAVRIVAGTTVNIRDGHDFGRYAARVEPWPRTLFFLGVNQPGSLIRTADVRASGGVRPDLGLCMDLDLWQQMLRAHGPDCVRRVSGDVATYRYHEASKTCREADPFALEEYALLFDLAISLGADLPAALANLRNNARFQPRPAAMCRLPISSAEAETALLDRLLVSDSLLFRALRKQTPSSQPLRAEFQSLLEATRPLLVRRFPDQTPDALFARAWVAAAQSLPRFAPGFYGSAFCARPSLAILTDALRALLRS